MAEAYVDQGAYASNLGDTPTWGVPQEGDGSSKDAATASSIASLLFNAVPTSGAFTLCGVTVSVTGVLSAASVDAAANALATNINATTTAVAAGVAYGVPQLRNLVFARGPAGGAPAGTCQIMMRVGSDSLNHASNALVAMAHTFNGTAPTITQFAGGSGGCWGWLVANQALGVSGSIAIRTYGMLLASPMVAYSGWAFTEYNTINVRTGRNITITITGNNSLGAQASRPGAVHFLFDDGTVWTGDPVDGSFKVSLAGHGFSISLVTNGGILRMTARRRGGFEFHIAAVSGSDIGLFSGPGSGVGGGFQIRRGVFREISGVPTYLPVPGGNSASAATRCDLSFIDCLFDYSVVARTALNRPFYSIVSSSVSPNIEFIDNDFVFNLSGVGGASATTEFIRAGTVNRTYRLTMRGNRFVTGQPDELVAFKTTGFVNDGCYIALENNTGIGLPSGAVGLTPSTAAWQAADAAILVLDQLAVGGAMKYETPRGYFEFVQGQPVLTAVAPDGVLWSWKAFWTQGDLLINVGRPLACPPSRVQSRLATAVRNWSLELLLDDVALAQLPLHAEVEVSYVTTGGAPRIDRVPATLVATSASWVNASTPPYNTWAARKITGTTAEPVLLNSVISARIVIQKSTEGGTAGVFFYDPEVALS